MSLEFDLTLKRRDFTLRVAGSWPLRGVTALFGPSGCGKTSLLRTLAGFESGAVGSIRFGTELWLDARRRLPPHRRGIGVVFQHAALLSHLDVRGNLAFALRRTPAARRRLGIEEVAQRCGLLPLLHRATHRLSGGERQRVALARALITCPRLLMLDEPLASLDLASRAELLPLLVDLHRSWNIPVIYVTHNPNELAAIADRVMCMRAGAIEREAEVAALLADPLTPLARSGDAQVVVRARVRDYDAGSAILHLAFAGGQLRILADHRPHNDDVRVVIHASDVSIALEPPGATSILNILPARITAIEDLGDGRCLIALDCSGTALLARITSYSAGSLDLRTGQLVYAQVKAMALAAALSS